MKQIIKKATDGAKTRIFKNYVTTIAGLVILGVAVWQWVEGKPLADVALISGYGILFLRSNDSLIGLPSKLKE